MSICQNYDHGEGGNNQYSADIEEQREPAQGTVNGLDQGQAHICLFFQIGKALIYQIETNMCASIVDPPGLGALLGQIYCSIGDIFFR